jgi:hypothetical protein
LEEIVENNTSHRKVSFTGQELINATKDFAKIPVVIPIENGVEFILGQANASKHLNFRILADGNSIINPNKQYFSITVISIFDFSDTDVGLNKYLKSREDFADLLLSDLAPTDDIQKQDVLTFEFKGEAFRCSRDDLIKRNGVFLDDGTGRVLEVMTWKKNGDPDYLVHIRNLTIAHKIS